MNFNNGKKYLFWGLTVFLSGGALILFYFLIFHLEEVLGGIKKVFHIVQPIFVGFILAWLLNPVINALENKLIYRHFSKIIFRNSKTEEDRRKTKRTMRTLCIILTYLLFILLVYGLFSLVIPELVYSIQRMANNFPTYQENLFKWLDGVLTRFPDIEQRFNDTWKNISPEFMKWIQEHILPGANSLLSGVTSGVKVVITTLLNIVVGLIVSIYILSSKESFSGQFKKFLYAFFSRKGVNNFLKRIRVANDTFQGFFVGKIVDSMIIGVLCYIVTKIMGTPYALLVSVIVGVTNIIPYFGPFIGAIPSAFIVLLADPKQCLYFIIMILILQQVDGNIIGPRILGESTGLSGFWVIFAITFFGGLFSFWGMLIGVPLFALLYAYLKEQIVEKLDSKTYSKRTSDYIYLERVEEDGSFIPLDPEQRKKDKAEKKNNIKKQKRSEN
ncbi:MAG: AI-2E family transporter [Lachnospiraceae bacterium]|nr:AI-2E family transporter [Lachnospiraceae bacterium]